MLQRDEEIHYGQILRVVNDLIRNSVVYDTDDHGYGSYHEMAVDADAWNELENLMDMEADRG